MHRKKHLQFIKKCGIICFGIKEWEFSHSFVLYNKNREMRSLSKAEEIAEREAEAICSGCGLYVYDVEYKKEGGENVLRVFIDSDSGVTLDECEKVSRALSDRLDELDPIKGAYELEISSPGVERIIKRDWHYDKALGKKIYVKLFGSENGEKELTGILKEAGDGFFVLETEKEDIKIMKDKAALVRTVFEF